MKNLKILNQEKTNSKERKIMKKVLASVLVVTLMGVPTVSGAFAGPTSLTQSEKSILDQKMNADPIFCCKVALRLISKSKEKLNSDIDIQKLQSKIASCKNINDLKNSFEEIEKEAKDIITALKAEARKKRKEETKEARTCYLAALKRIELVKQHLKIETNIIKPIEQNLMETKKTNELKEKSSVVSKNPEQKVVKSENQKETPKDSEKKNTQMSTREKVFIGAEIAVAALLGYELYKHGPEIEEFVGKCGTSVTDATKTALNATANAAAKFVTGTKNVAKTALNATASTAKNLGSKVADATKIALNATASTAKNFSSKVVGVTETALNATASTFKNMYLAAKALLPIGATDAVLKNKDLEENSNFAKSEMIKSNYDNGHDSKELDELYKYKFLEDEFQDGKINGTPIKELREVNTDVPVKPQRKGVLDFVSGQAEKLGNGISSAFKSVKGWFTKVKPVETKPANKSTELVPVETEPANKSTELVPVETEPANKSTALVPVETEPTNKSTEFMPVENQSIYANAGLKNEKPMKDVLLQSEEINVTPIKEPKIKREVNTDSIAEKLMSVKYSPKIGNTKVPVKPQRKGVLDFASRQVKKLGNGISSAFNSVKGWFTRKKQSY